MLPDRYARHSLRCSTMAGDESSMELFLFQVE